jgi:hypothetical protein
VNVLYPVMHEHFDLKAKVDHCRNGKAVSRKQKKIVKVMLDKKNRSPQSGADISGKDRRCCWYTFPGIIAGTSVSVLFVAQFQCI